eukprot:TRINITY_DN104213_c0_g1_i1.p1 TRINITY_DN104213_c0_g1~~TRINITY_DN104213_c0_g1_i1.p1  ORF type:complete len:369 (-),score=15.16 TRINITY_DN104213_c0_g1_i1:247-1353(-)
MPRRSSLNAGIITESSAESLHAVPRKLDNLLSRTQSFVLSDAKPSEASLTAMLQVKAALQCKPIPAPASQSWDNIIRTVVLMIYLVFFGMLFITPICGMLPLGLPTPAGWMHSAYVEVNLNAAASRHARQTIRHQNYNLWCAIADIETYWLKATGMAKSTSTADAQGADNCHGWYHLQGCGLCFDYCRRLGNSGSGGHPPDRITMQDSYWSCRPADGSETHATYASRSLGKCSGERANAPGSCSAFRTSLTCPTYTCAWRGNACETPPSQYAVCRTTSYFYYASYVSACDDAASSSWAACGWHYSPYSPTNCGSVPTCATYSCLVSAATPSIPMVLSTPGCCVCVFSKYASQSAISILRAYFLCLDDG